MKNSPLIGALCTALLLIICGTAQAATVTFSTGDFTNSDWTSHILAGSTGTSVATTEVSGGNPGAYRRVSLAVDAFESVVNSQIWDLSAYNPSVQGAVSAVALSYDISRVFTSNAGATQVTKGIAVSQDGIVYRHFLGVSTASPPTWEAVSVVDIVPLFTSVNWSAGNEITFGFYDNVGTSPIPFTIDGGYDNFEVTISSVPIPASFFLLVSGLLGLTGIATHKKA